MTDGPEAALLIRPYRPEDGAGLLDLFRRAVHETAARDYTPAQRAAWAPELADPAPWIARRGDRPTFVATVDGALAGFSDLLQPEPGRGHVDMLFVHPAFARQGIASALLAAVEAEARRQGLGRLTAEASLTARPVFERHGFGVVARQEVSRNGETLVNFRMEKALGQREETGASSQGAV